MPVVIDSPSPNESVGVCAWHNCVQVVDTYVVVALPIISSILYIILIVQLGIHMIIHLQLLLSQDDRALPVETAFFIRNSFPVHVVVLLYLCTPREVTILAIQKERNLTPNPIYYQFAEEISGALPKAQSQNMDTWTMYEILIYMCILGIDCLKHRRVLSYI